MPENSQEIRDNIRESVGKLAESDKVKRYLNNVFTKLEAIRGQNRSTWDVWKIVILNFDFFFAMLPKIKHLYRILKCAYDVKYKEALADSNFMKELLDLPEVQTFNEELKSHKDQIQGAIQYMLTLKENDPEKLLDQNFIKNIVEVLEKNQNTFSKDEMTAVINLLMKRTLIENTSRDKKQLSENALEILSVMLPMIGQVDGLNEVIKSKIGPISKMLAEGLTLNGVSGPITIEGLSLNGVAGLITKEEAQAILTNVMNSKESLKELCNALGQTCKLMRDDEPGNVMKMISIMLGVMSKHMHEGGKAIANNSQLILNQCFEVNLEESENGKIVYQLSGLGKKMAQFGVLKLNNAAQAIDPETWRTVVGGELLMYVKQPTPVDKLRKFFSLEMIKEFLGLTETQAPIPVKDSAKVTKAEFAKITSQFNGTLLTSALPVFMQKKETIEQFGHFLGNVGNDMPVFKWMGEGLQAINHDEPLMNFLFDNKDEITEVAKKATPPELLVKFGLTKDFLEIVKPILKDKDTVKNLYHAVCHMNSDNNSDMTKKVIEILQQNQELKEFLQKDNNQTEITKLVKALSSSVDMMKEYFTRSEFKPLGENIETALKDVLASTMGLVFNPEADLLSKVDHTMQYNQLINGFMLSDAAYNVRDRQVAEKTSKELYLYLIKHDGKITAENFKEIEEQLKDFGINSADQLQQKISEGIVIDKANKLFNEISGIFKADFPTEQREAKQAIIQRYADEKQAVIKILTSYTHAGYLEFADRIDEAVVNDEISSGNAFFLKNKVQEYLGENDADQVFARLSYEVSMKGIENMNILSDIIFSLRNRVESAQINGDLNLQNVQDLLKENSLALTQYEIATISSHFMNGKMTITHHELISKLSDFGCRRRVAEGIGEIQGMLSSVLAPFAALTALPYSLKSTDFASIIGQIDVNHDYDSATLITLLGNDEKIVETLLSRQSNIKGDKLKEELGYMEAKQVTAEKEYTKTVRLLNKILRDIPTNTKFLQAIQRVVTEKGSIESQSHVIIEALGAIFASDKYTSTDFASIIGQIDGNHDYDSAALITLLGNDEKIVETLLNGQLNIKGDKLKEELGYMSQEKQFLATKVVMPILHQNQMPVGVLNVLKTVINEVSTDSKRAQDLYVDPYTETLITNILKKDGGALVNRGSIGSARKIGLLNSLKIGLQFKFGIIADNQAQVAEFKKILESVRAVNHQNVIDIRAIARKDFRESGLYLLAGKRMKDLNLSNCKFDEFAFEAATFTNINFENAQLIKCNFDNAEFTNVKLNGAKFDLVSLQSFISAAEKQGLNVLQLLEGVKVTTKICGEANAQLVYDLIQHSKLNGIPMSEEVIMNAIRLNLTHNDFDFFNEFNGRVATIWKNNILLEDVAKLRIECENKGLLSEVLRENLPNSGINAVRRKCVSEICSGNADYESPLKRMNSIISENNADKINALNYVIDNVFAGALGTYYFPSIQSITTVIDVCEENINIIQSFNAIQKADLIHFIKLNREKENLKALVKDFSEILQSENHENIHKIAHHCESDSLKRFDLYQVLKTEAKLNELFALTKGFAAQTDFSKILDVHSILNAWYIQRANGKMNPEVARGGDKSGLDCLKNALQFQQKHEFASKIARDIATALFLDKAFSVADRLNDLEKIYNSSVTLYDALPEAQKSALNDESFYKTFIGDRNTGLISHLYKQTSYVKTGFGVYLPSNFDVKNCMQTMLSENGVLTEQIIAQEGTLESKRDKLYTLDKDVLNVILKHAIEFGKRSAVDVKQGALRRVNDSTIQDQMYLLHADAMEKILTTQHFENIKGYVKSANKTLSDVIQNQLNSIELTEAIIQSKPALADRRYELYGLKENELNNISSQLHNELFDQMLKYSENGDIPLNDMMKNLNTINSLQSLSNELKDRYDLVNKSDSEKLCLNLIVKTYNALEEPLKNCINNREEGRALIAEIFFVKLQSLEKVRPPVDLNNLENCKNALVNSVKVISQNLNPNLMLACHKQGQDIAKQVFSKLNIGENWPEAQKTKSITNLGNTLAARLLVSGKTLDENQLKEVIGHVNSTDTWRGRVENKTGLVDVISKIYYSIFTGWYEFSKFDTKDNHTSTLIARFDGLINGHALQHSQSINQSIR